MFESSLFLEIELGLGKRKDTLQKTLTSAYIPKPEKRSDTLQILMTWSYVPNIAPGPYDDHKMIIRSYAETEARLTGEERLLL